MREFLRHPLFWLWETARWHWFEVMITSMVIWACLILALALINLLS